MWVHASVSGEVSTIATTTSTIATTTTNGGGGGGIREEDLRVARSIGIGTCNGVAMPVPPTPSVDGTVTTTTTCCMNGGHVEADTAKGVSLSTLVSEGSLVHQGFGGLMMEERERVVSKVSCCVIGALSLSCWTDVFFVFLYLRRKLASLASQHHMSEHARSKHGANGT